MNGSGLTFYPRRFHIMRIFLLSLVVLFQGIALNAQAQDKLFRAAVDSSGVQRVEITGGSYYFDPDHIIVTVNVPVELTLTKEAGMTPHDIIIDAPEAGIEIREDMSTEPKTVRFTPVKTGSYEITCGKRFLFFKSHKDRGMKGILEVVD
jgi:plastocyanin